MGTKNPDVVRPPPAPETALTLAEMHLAGWELKATCPKCRLSLRADLRSMIRVYGPDAIWWGKRPKCPGWECETGELIYSARSLASGSWKSMRSPPPQRLVDLWLARQRRGDRGPR